MSTRKPNAMNDLTKTLVFVGVAAFVGLLAFFLQPEPLESPRQQAGERLFTDLKDATLADAMQIVQYEPDLAKAIELKIRRDGDRWVIASHNDYPADASDAKQRIEDMAVKLSDLKVVDVASELTSEQRLYGVVSPTGDAVKETDEKDIGMLVGIEDNKGNILAQLIVGKTVRDTQSQQPKRFVRKAGDSTIYTAELDVEQLQSKFSDWIEPDLLKINSGDIRRVTIKDYNVHLVEVQGPDGQPRDAVGYEPRFELSTDWDAEKSEWKFVSMVERRGNSLAPSKLTDDEQLNADKLDGLKQAVDNLKIVDVTSKPKQLIEGVKSDDDLINDPRISSLLEEKGFFPMRGELLSSDGEVRVQTAEGIEYILRFGNEAGVEHDAETGESKLTRYLLVSAKVAEEQMVSKPKEEASPDSDNPLGPPLGAGGVEGESGEAASGDSDASAVDDAAGENEEETDDETPMPPDPIPPAADEPKQDDELVKKRKAAEAKVAELNQRFAPWYYVISEDEYKQIRLGRFEVIQEKDDASFGIDELRDLDETPPGAPR